jgi:hypothetical protein
MLKLHKDFPLPAPYLIVLIRDILELYPETKKISIVGTYARLDEPVSSKKKHDLDILIHFPETKEELRIRQRNDDSIWRKWGEDRVGITVDFLMKFGRKNSKYGKHLWRQEQKLPTPSITIWEKPRRIQK